PPLDHHRLAALLARPVGGDLLALDVAHLGLRLLELLLEGPVERAEQPAPVLGALLYLVEIRLHLRREVARHDLGEALDEQTVDEDAELGREEPRLALLDVPAVDDRRHDRRVRRRATDAALLELLDERRLGVPRRRLREVL